MMSFVGWEGLGISAGRGERACHLRAPCPYTSPPTGDGTGSATRHGNGSCVSAWVPVTMGLVIASGSVMVRAALKPSEEDVARRPHQTVAGLDALPVILMHALAGIGFEHRRLGFLDLQENRVVVVGEEELRHITYRRCRPRPP